MKRITILFCSLLLTFALFTLCAGAEEVEGNMTADETAEDENTEKSAFSIAYDELVANADKILSALAFIGSLILAFSYKKGLFPIVKGTLTKLTSVVGEIGERADSIAQNGEENAKLISERLKKTEEMISHFGESISAVEKELESAKENQKNEENFRIILRAQVDMLYEIFMSSSLPQYSKDAVGEKISAMKAALSQGENSEE